MKKEIYFDSSGQGKLRGCIWLPDVPVRGVIQIVHGIAEHMDRYDAMAQYFNQYGYVVVGEDHMGHGLSAADESQKGCFHGTWHSVVKDTYNFLTLIREEYPDVPYFIFGHSMGSFITRTLLCAYPSAPIQGCVLSGTAWMPEIVLGAGRVLSNLVCRIKGETSTSNLLQNLMFGSYNSGITEKRTDYDWLSRDGDVVDAYIEDPMCGFMTSAGLIRDMLTGMLYNQKGKHLDNMNKSLPVHFLSGDQDPVGDFGKGVRTAYDKFLASGMENVSIKLYPGCRHEVHNELGKEEMFQDLLEFMKR